MMVDGGWWPAGCTWLADTCTRAKGIKRREQMQEPVRSSNQALVTDCLKEREESGLLPHSPHQGLRIVEGITEWLAGRHTGRVGR